ncbi:MAG TPA: UDP-N-acetylmuramate dehydrogenase [Chloroflexota bacterium]|jgi:UDP-N-acetylmuramate dehydrogenase|nr:UDP-N-acetylmuramate dehydrogenase [Chloroflexota bacterium]
MALAARLRLELGSEDVREQAALAPYTTWRVGGPADLLCIAEQVEHIVAAAQAAEALGVPWRVLGRGSNVLVRDGGVAGLVILNRTRGLEIAAPLVIADGGLLLSTLARRTAAAGLAGMEWSAGIPGSVGGAVVSNAGAHGGEMADTLQRALLLRPAARHDCAGNLLVGDVPLADEQATAQVAAIWHSAADLDLAYRHSRLRSGPAPEEIVLRAEFRLAPDAPAAIHARMEEQKRQRKATQPLSQASAGSVFKNPPGDSAARLIDQAGLKGMRSGGAQVSPRHANFMVTQEGARAGDLLALIALVQRHVQERFGVHLTLEVQPIGRETTIH